MRKKQSGVTLMELMVVVTVVAILGAIAVPSYRSYTRRAGRADAKTALLAAASQLERCFTRFNAYDHEDCDVTFPVTSTEGKYTINTSALAATAFTLQATAVTGQGQVDDECGSFTLDSANTRGTSKGDAQKCWGR